MGSKHIILLYHVAFAYRYQQKVACFKNASCMRSHKYYSQEDPVVQAAQVFLGSQECPLPQDIQVHLSGLEGQFYPERKLKPIRSAPPIRTILCS